jgi:hypothetical protein
MKPVFYFQNFIGDASFKALQLKTSGYSFSHLWPCPFSGNIPSVCRPLSFPGQESVWAYPISVACSLPANRRQKECNLKKISAEAYGNRC